MKSILFLFLLQLNFAAAQPVFTKNTNDYSAILQAAFNGVNNHQVVINKEIWVEGAIQIPGNKVLKFEAGGIIRGGGSITGGIIEAGYHHQIFDTSIQIFPRAVGQYFSAKWFGAKGNNTDDYAAIQKSINTCIRNNIRTLFIPAGQYKISQPLIIRGIQDPQAAVETRWFCTLDIVGESSFWDSNMGTEILPTFTNTFAIGIQTGKGCKIRKLKISGLFKPPHSNDPTKFFNTSFEEFTDGICRDSRFSPYAAIVIDPFTNLATDATPADGGYPGLTSYYGKANNLLSLSGSTATELEELSINGFVVGICSSPNGVSKNAELTIINKVQFENCKLAISGGQAQEKMNTISTIACWGGTHTIFATGLYGSTKEAGNWYINQVNIAGGVVRFIYNDQQGYFPVFINAVYAESLATWGTINSELATSISNCVIDFADPGMAGNQILLTSWGKNVVYKNCNFRYYGTSQPLLMEGNCVFDNCYFSGKLKRTTSSAFSLMQVTDDPTSKRSLITIIFYVAGVAVVIIAVLIFLLLRKRKPVQTR